MHSSPTQSLPLQSSLTDQRHLTNGINPPLLESPIDAFNTNITHNSSKLEIPHMETNPTNETNVKHCDEHECNLMQISSSSSCSSSAESVENLTKEKKQEMDHFMKNQDQSTKQIFAAEAQAHIKRRHELRNIKKILNKTVYKRSEEDKESLFGIVQNIKCFKEEFKLGEEALKEVASLL